MRISAAPSEAPFPRPYALHCGMFSVDIASFSSRCDPAVQRHLRDAVHRIVRNACQAVDLDWDACHHEDRGDGLFVIAPPEASVEVILGPLVTRVVSGVREHNKLTSRAAQINLRMAVHAGYVHLDDHGATGMALIHLFRLLDAPMLKAALARSFGDFSLIVSDHLYQEVVLFNSGLIEADVFHPVTVQVKETDCVGWVWLPRAGPQAGPGLSTGVVLGGASLPVSMHRNQDEVSVELASLVRDILQLLECHSADERADILIAATERLSHIAGIPPDDQR